MANAGAPSNLRHVAQLQDMLIGIVYMIACSISAMLADSNWMSRRILLKLRLLCCDAKAIL